MGRSRPVDLFAGIRASCARSARSDADGSGRCRRSTALKKRRTLMVEVSRRRFLAETSLGLGVGFGAVAAFRAATLAPPAPAMRQNPLAIDALQGASLPGI